MEELVTTTAGLWLAVFLSGLYHGINPGMGWPLAVSAALMEQRPFALWRALGALAAGHFLAMLAILTPFAVLTALVQWQREIQIAAALLVMSMGLYLVITRRHPRFLSRIPPARLMLWSFLVALAHGAALMLVPIYLGLCDLNEQDAGHVAAGALMTSNAGLTLLVAVFHTAAMIFAGAVLSVAVYRWLGLRYLSRGWFDLELVWALSLLAVGAFSLWVAI